ncbi:epoxide hydrolase 2 [Fusarium albosuccineum]|uniref:Epoxide hydrolase 2 n=1 Tax=Fusarium albosuccineum TaxID=1237068 RepID=A0A8H4LIE7_9HYPO|nr:epoxide hydrolase 2 [Fusarium albosuccineum]
MSPSDKNHFQIVYDEPSLSKGTTRRNPGGTGAKATDLDLQAYPFPKSESFSPYRVIPDREWSQLRSCRNFRLKDTKFSLGDFVKVTNRSPYRGDRAKRMNGGSKGPRRDRVAYILEIKAADERNVFARVYWMYWPEDMPKDKPGFSDEKLESEPNELIASNHMEIINVMSVSGLETVNHMRDSRTDPHCNRRRLQPHNLARLLSLQEAPHSRRPLFHLRSYELRLRLEAFPKPRPNIPDQTRMEFDKLTVNGLRAASRVASVRGKSYHYIRTGPVKDSLGTIILLHGFPDLGFGWRYQIPYLASLGYEVVAPDMLGFGDTDAPDHPRHYKLRSIAEDVKELAGVVSKKEKVILGGHGRGAAAAWRVAMWFPDLVQGLFSIGIPFIPPSSIFLSLDDVTRSGKFTTLRHQLQFKGREVEDKIRDKEEVRQFLNAMFGGTTSEGEPGFDATNGILFDILPRLDQSHIISGDELDHYVSKYSHDGNARLKTPINWFRTRVQNYLDELQLLLKPIRFSMPVLFLAPTKDGALPRGTADDMDRYFENLTREEVEASHWVMWESPTQVNERVAAWLRNV